MTYYSSLYQSNT